MSRDELRAGDDDRQAVADRLKDALDQGRLDLHEYDERLQGVYAAKTYGDLDGLTADLPGTVPEDRSRLATTQPSAPQHSSGQHSGGQHSGGQHSDGQGLGAGAGDVGEKGSRPPFLSGYAGVVVVCVIIWAMTSLGTGEWQYFWPGWMLIPLLWGAFGHFRGRGR